MEYGVKSDVGMIRSKNQDNYLILNKDIQIFAVADGMGGHKAGEVASQMALDVINQYNGQTDDIQLMLNDVINQANEMIFARQSVDIECEGMGTTLTVAIVKENLLYIGHVGDSRAYLFSNNQDLKQITTDHSFVNELLKQDQITEAEALNHPQKHVLLQALGSESRLNIEINCISLERSDIILLCTDGLTNMLSDIEIAEILYGSGTLQEKTELLVDHSNLKGGWDNITVILFKPVL